MKRQLIFTWFFVVCGCAHTLQLACVDGLTIALPPRFMVEQVAATDPLGDMVVGRWKSASGEVVELMAWPNGPSVDRGPMVVATEELMEVAGQQTKLVRTSVFFGSTNEVLVIHLRQDQARFLIWAKGIKVEDFKEILRSVKLERK